MTGFALLVICSRWVHIVAACLALGGLFTMRVILPSGLALIEPSARRIVFLKCRRVFKMTIHGCILLLLLSGTFNAWVNWPVYKVGVPLTHAFLGVHILLALVVFAIALYVLTPKESPALGPKLMLLNLLLLLLTIAAASTLKYVREHPPKQQSIGLSQ